MNASAILPNDPLSHPGTVKILLGREVSDALAAAGDYHLMQATRSQAHGGRFVLIALPLDKPALDAAARVALGKARAVPVKPTATNAAHAPSSKPFSPRQTIP
jgi:hypothetical protein